MEGTFDVSMKDLNDIMSKMESSDNFYSFVNENDHEEENDVGLEDEDKVDCEVQNDDYGDYDDFWIPDVSRFDFAELELAYVFYYWREKGSTSNTRKRRERKESRCGCEAMFRVHVHFSTGRWKMSTIDIMQIENYRKVGIGPPHMYAAFANHCGGYDKVGFIRKDIYNQEVHMRKQHTSDASGALKYLHDLRKKDLTMYVLYTVDEGSRLQRLFWCDTESQLLYGVFGDILAFDATYKKNKYLCPFVVFSSVNHHNQTIVFAAAIVTDETKETYVWLLEQFLEAMKGKAPSSIITDGDLAMRNAITRVMPSVFHKLCAWHLLRNALSHVGDKQVLKWLKNLMLGDFEVVTFEEKWKEMIATFELEDNSWIAELYEKWMKWSTAHLRSHFFAGIRTTSHCEAFHAHVAKYMATFSVYTVVKYCSESVWYATLVQVSREVCEAAYFDEDEYDKMLHFLSNEGHNYDGILDPIVVRTKGCGQVGVDESGKRRRIQKCGQCGGSGHNKCSCTNRPRNANVCVGGSFISSSEQTNTMCQPTDEYNYQLLMQQPHTFVAGSSRPGP
ncbi:Protein FAR1-RELATED SEQUENCE 5 [Glycine soja]|uniref:Protein FAR1-RELATED SEQUENCE 5 n=1 Tax=Glycine soja TaxID=3848 RepID=A0A0B2Q3W8_GLYSO|nr:Protein FAR1-RELATED SEQUENCE 5 [Glycine soja]